MGLEDRLFRWWPKLKELPELAAKLKRVVDRLLKMSQSPITHSEFNQLVHALGLPGMGHDFFRFYFTAPPQNHPWDIQARPAAFDARGIATSQQLEQGVERFMIDALLYKGNLMKAYEAWRELSTADLIAFFASKHIDTQRMQMRGPILDYQSIPVDDRYLISENACKAYEPTARATLEEQLRKVFKDLSSKDKGSFELKDLLKAAKDNTPAQLILGFDTGDFISHRVSNEAEIEARVKEYGQKFEAARNKATHNTNVYLSVCRDLDVYAATSMRTRDQFRIVAKDLESIFGNPDLQALNIRFFDPTSSASKCHEDKGLLECIMVRAAKCVLYFDQERETWGKITEAAMGLTLGKAVVVVCPNMERASFLRSAHPLGRLVFHQTGMAVGIMVVENNEKASELLHRLFTNRMRYSVEADQDGYYRLIEDISRCIVRVQTSDRDLLSAFQEYYRHG